MGLFDASPVFNQTDSSFIQALQLLAVALMSAGGYYLIRRMNGYRLRPTPAVRVRPRIQPGSSTMTDDQIDTSGDMIDWSERDEEED